MIYYVWMWGWVVSEIFSAYASGIQGDREISGLKILIAVWVTLFLVVDYIYTKAIKDYKRIVSEWQEICNELHKENLAMKEENKELKERMAINHMKV